MSVNANSVFRKARVMFKRLLAYLSPQDEAQTREQISDLFAQISAIRDEVEWGRYVIMPDGETDYVGDAPIGMRRPAVFFTEYKAEILALIDQILELAPNSRLYHARKMISRAPTTLSIMYAFTDVKAPL
jgi:hypothetical protein